MCKCGQKVHVYVKSNVIEYSRMFWNVHVLNHVHGDLKDFSRVYALIISLQTLQLVLASSC